MRTLQAKKYFNPYRLLKNLPTARAAYSDRMAWICAKMSALAYIKFEADHNELAVLKISLESGGFSLVEMFNRNGTQAILASCEDFNILAFRGTEKDGKDDYGRVKMYQMAK